jgi:hypothetical protein
VRERHRILGRRRPVVDARQQVAVEVDHLSIIARGPALFRQPGDFL